MGRFPSHKETRENGTPAPHRLGGSWVGPLSPVSLGQGLLYHGFRHKSNTLVAANGWPCFRLSTDRFRARQELHIAAGLVHSAEKSVCDNRKEDHVITENRTTEPHRQKS
jgi:hypothetical protein